MNATEVIRRLHEHRAWTNGKLQDAARELSSESLQKKFAIGQGSIFRSLVHMYAAEYIWLETLLGDESPVVPGDLPGKLPGNQEGEGPIVSFEELEAKWRQLETRWQAYLNTLKDKDLDQIVFKISTSSNFGKRQPTRRADILMHICLHAHYTAAQVINMLRQLGVEKLPDPMLISLARQQMI